MNRTLCMRCNILHVVAIVSSVDDTVCKLKLVLDILIKKTPWVEIPVTLSL
jgi:hypothetical protein